MVHVERRGGVRTAGLGVLVALWAFADGLIVGVPAFLATVATGRPVLVYPCSVVVFTALNLFVCRWLDDEWDTWVVGSGFEARLVKLRSSDRARRAVAAAEPGTARGYGIGAALLSASQVVALHRVATGEPTSVHNRRVASVVPALLYPALYVLLGWLVHDLG